MAVNEIVNLKLGPCQVLYDGTDIGWTFGGVTVSLNDTYADVKVDQQGTTALDKVNSGTEVRVEIPFAELTHENLALITGETVESGAGTQKRVKIASRAGCSLKDNAAILILKPLDCGTPTTDENEWWTFPQAGFESTIEDTFDPEGQRVWKATAHCFPDDTDSMTFAVFGDVDLGVV